MATKTISLDEEAYNRLKERKSGSESFSDVVKKLAPEHSLDEIVGIWEGETEGIRDTIEEGRENSRKRQERVKDELSQE